MVTIDTKKYMELNVNIIPVILVRTLNTKSITCYVTCCVYCEKRLLCNSKLICNLWLR